VGNQLQLFFFLDVPDEVIFDRIENRLVHVASGRVYHKTFNPPKVAGFDDITGEPLIQREDDTHEFIATRLSKFYQHTRPLLEYYKKRGILKVIPSPNSEEGYKHIKEVWNELFGEL